MLLDILFAILAGVSAGIITGLTPGIHVNLVSSVAIALPFSFGSVIISVFIVSMAITHTFLDAIPSIYLGAPEESTALAVLPGHRFLMKGMGHEAVKLTLIGSVFALVAGVVLIPAFAFLFPLVYSFSGSYLWFVLACTAVFMIFKEKDINRIFWSSCIFIFSAVLGMSVFCIEISQPLLPMLSGLFGTSTLIYSLSRNSGIPFQDSSKRADVYFSGYTKFSFAGIISGAFTALLPGLGASHAAAIASSFSRNMTSSAYLIVVGAVSTANFVVSIATFWSIGKARNGAVSAIMQAFGMIGAKEVFMLSATALFAGGIAAVIALKSSKIFCSFVEKVNYNIICLAVILIVSFICTVFSGFAGLLILALSTAIGILAVLVGAPRNSAMGCIIVPSIIYLF